MRYFTGFLIAIGLIVLVFVIILKGDGNSTRKQQIDLNSYANSEAMVQVTIDGPITADQTHQVVQISVGRSEGRIDILQGYEGSVKTTQTYQNNQNSYAVLLHALTLTGFTKGASDAKQNDERGYCPTGERYIFELLQGGDTIQRYWATSCGGQGTYRGSVGQTVDLFRKQIPDYGKLTANIIF